MKFGRSVYCLTLISFFSVMLLHGMGALIVGVLMQPARKDTIDAVFRFTYLPYALQGLGWCAASSICIAVLWILFRKALFWRNLWIGGLLFLQIVFGLECALGFSRAPTLLSLVLEVSMLAMAVFSFSVMPILPFVDLKKR